MYAPVTRSTAEVSRSAYHGYSAASTTVYGGGMKTKYIQLASVGFLVLGIILLILGVTMLGCGTVTVIVGVGDTSITGFLAGIFKMLTGLFVTVNGIVVYKASTKPVIKKRQLNLMLPFCAIGLLVVLTTAVLATVALFQAYVRFGEKLQTTCDRDSNSFAQVVADSQYSGANLNPNYNPNCVANNPNCNINAAPILSYNFAYWYSQMQNNILQLYNYFKYVFRYSFAIDGLLLLFCIELSAIEIGLLIIIGHLMEHINDSKKYVDESASVQDPTLLGSQMAMPLKSTVTGAAHKAVNSQAPPAYSKGNPDEPIYANVHALNRQQASSGVVGPNSSWSVYSPNQHQPGNVI